MAEDTAQPTLEQIPNLLRENFDRLSQFSHIPTHSLLHVICTSRIAFHNALRAVTLKHFIKVTKDTPLLICVSSSHLQGDVEDALKVRANGLQDWVYPELKSLPRTEWHGTPPVRLIGSSHLSDMRFELKDFAETVCGLLLPDPPWRAFLASQIGRTLISMQGDHVGDWIERDGYVKYEFAERSTI